MTTPTCPNPPLTEHVMLYGPAPTGRRPQPKPDRPPWTSTADKVRAAEWRVRNARALLAELRAAEDARTAAKQAAVARQRHGAAARRGVQQPNGPAPTAADTHLIVSQWRARRWQ